MGKFPCSCCLSVGKLLLTSPWQKAAVHSGFPFLTAEGLLHALASMPETSRGACSWWRAWQLPASSPAASCQVPMVGHVGHNVLVPQDSPAWGHRGKSWWDEPRHHGPVWAVWQGKVRWWCPTCLCNHHGKTVCERLSPPCHAISNALRWAHAMPAVGSNPELQAEILGECGLELRRGAHSWHTSLEQATPKTQMCVPSHHSWGLQSPTWGSQPETSALVLLKWTQERVCALLSSECEQLVTSKGCKQGKGLAERVPLLSQQNIMLYK